MAELNDQDRDAIIASLYAGQKIQAIKQYRAATGLGLKESKDFIDALEARLRQDTPDRFQTSQAGCGAGVLLIVMLTAVLAGAAGFVMLLLR